jgi:hypothetical protein
MDLPCAGFDDLGVYRHHRGRIHAHIIAAKGIDTLYYLHLD